MTKLEITLPDALVARLEAAAAAADVPTAAYAGALIGEALEVGVFGAQTPPQPASRPQGVPEVGLGGGGGPQVVARTPGGLVEPEPGSVSVVSLLLALHRGDVQGAAVILESVSLPLLIADATSWFNALGIREYGVDEWDRRLQAFLVEAARLRSDSPGGDHSA